jgi:hypothetical protein
MSAWIRLDVEKPKAGQRVIVKIGRHAGAQPNRIVDAVRSPAWLGGFKTPGKGGVCITGVVAWMPIPR